MATQHHRANLRGAYTLMEMVIVMTVLVALVAVIWPAMRGPLAKTRLQESAKHVGSVLARARLMAIETGTIHQFRYQPAGREFDITPYRAPQADATAEAIGPAAWESPEQQQKPAVAGDEGNLAALDSATRFLLPDGIVFFTPEPGEPDPLDFSQPGVVDSEGFGPPIFFYPSGRSSNACLRLYGQSDWCVDLTLRGLTGTTTITPPRAKEVLP